jgi:hypothetical protein
MRITLLSAYICCKVMRDAPPHALQAKLSFQRFHGQSFADHAPTAMRPQRVMAATLEYASAASANAGIPRLLIMKKSA